MVFGQLKIWHGILLNIRLWARVFYEQIVNEVQLSWLSLVENEGSLLF